MEVRFVLFQFGIDANLLHKIEGNVHDVVECFYGNLASLPRRNARENRRGKILKKIHQKEDRKTVRVQPSSLLSSPVQSTTSTPSIHSHSNPTSTPEMDRLEARSKAAQRNKSESMKTEPLSNPSSATKRLKLSLNDHDPPKVASSPIKVATGALSSSAKTKSTQNGPVPSDSVADKPVGEVTKIKRKKLKRNMFPPPVSACKISRS